MDNWENFKSFMGQDIDTESQHTFPATQLVCFKAGTSTLICVLGPGLFELFLLELSQSTWGQNRVFQGSSPWSAKPLPASKEALASSSELYQPTERGKALK